jgi:hypothetical protein
VSQEHRLPIQFGVTVTRAITPKRHQTQLCLGGGGRTVDAEALGAVPAGHSIVSLSIRCRNSRVTVTLAITPKFHQTRLCLGWGGRTVDVEALGAVPAGHSIIALSIRARIAEPD